MAARLLRGAARPTLLLLVEALRVECAGSRRNTEEKRQTDQGGSNGLHGVPPSVDKAVNIIVAREQRATGSGAEPRDGEDKGALIDRQLRGPRACAMIN